MVEIFGSETRESKSSLGSMRKVRNVRVRGVDVEKESGGELMAV